LEPHLGVVRIGGARDGTEFVMADIPGLIEGAAEGKGLGHQFLRHIERARVLVVLLDLDPTAADPPSQQLRVLLGELGDYQPELLERPRIVVGAKADLVGLDVDDAGDAGGEDSQREDGTALCELLLSSATGAGVQTLVQRLAAMVQEVRTTVAVEATSAIVIHRPVPEGVEVIKLNQGEWQVLGRVAERAVAFSDLTDDGAMEEAVKRLRRLGVDRALTRAGVREGDEVTVGNMTFTWGEQ
jgi:GTP-binding protein